jgi:hypothetical protein
MPDHVVLRERTYAIAGVDGEGLFDPSEAGLSPVPSCTACQRGYVCRYAVRDDQLVLDGLKISLVHLVEGELEPRRGPRIHGVEPKTPGEGHVLFNNVYEGLALPIPFTGAMLVGDDFVQELYRHMGFHPAWKYRTVLELSFEEGHLVVERDVSEKMAAVRRAKGQAGSAGRRKEHVRSSH